MLRRRISADKARKEFSLQKQLDTDESDAGSEYMNDDFDSDDGDEYFDLNDQTLASDSSNDKNDSLHESSDDEQIDQAIQSAIRDSIGDQSARQFSTTADRTSKARVIWNKLDVGASARIRNRIIF